MIHMEQDQHDLLTRQLMRFNQAENKVEFLLGVTLQNNGDIARLSGLNTTTVRKIREGKKPTRAMVAALKVVYLDYLLNLKGA